jgi:hypothetical protein
MELSPDKKRSINAQLDLRTNFDDFLSFLSLQAPNLNIRGLFFFPANANKIAQNNLKIKYFFKMVELVDIKQT